MGIFEIVLNAFSRNWASLVALLLLEMSLTAHCSPTVVFLKYARDSGEIPAKGSSKGYACIWKLDSWVHVYYTIKILTLPWSLTIMIQARVFEISGMVFQWCFAKDHSAPKLGI